MGDIHVRSITFTTGARVDGRALHFVPMGAHLVYMGTKCRALHGMGGGLR